MSVEVRAIKEEDIAQAWELMKGLAIFEDYIETFVITPELVKQKMFKEKVANCLVADVDGEIAGILVYFFQQYTAQNKPYMHMKELFVKEGFRGQKIGTKLIQKAKEVAKEHGCWNIKWTVADWNTKAKEFYKKQGAEEDRVWLNYAIKID